MQTPWQRLVFLGATNEHILAPALRFQQCRVLFGLFGFDVYQRTREETQLHVNTIHAGSLEDSKLVIVAALRFVPQPRAQVFGKLQLLFRRLNVQRRGRRLGHPF
jgi:hypothetical protein